MPIRLTRLTINDEITDKDRAPHVTPTQRFLRYWNRLLEQIEGAITDISDLVAAIIDLNDLVTEAQEDADDALLGVGDHETRLDTIEGVLTDGALQVKDEGGAGADTHTMNFVGSGVSAAVASGVATVTINTGGSFAGALVKKSVDQTGLNASAGTAIAWDAEEYDTSAFHDTVTNNTRMTIPASGVTKVRLTAGLHLNNVTNGDFILVYFQKNGAFFPGAAQAHTDPGSTSPRASISSAVVAVSPGDYFEVWLITQSDTSVDIESDSSYFAIEVVAT